MSDVETDPDAMTDSAKLDQLLGLVATMNTWLDHQSQQLATVEMAIPLLAQLAALPFRQGLWHCHGIRGGWRLGRNTA
jgi:hypothetical protein